jgi:hypothetical protein
MRAMTFGRGDVQASAAAVKSVMSTELAVFLQRMQPSTGARILDVGGSPLFWSSLDRRSNPLNVTVVNLPGLLELQEPTLGVTVINSNLESLARLVADRVIDIVICREVMEPLGEGPQIRGFAQQLRGLGCGYWLQTSYRAPRLLGYLGHGEPQMELDRPNWMEGEQQEAIVDRHRLAALFPDATGLVTLRRAWFETAHAVYRLT